MAFTKMGLNLLLLAILPTGAFAQLTITTSSTLPTGMVTRVYSVTLTATGGTNPVTFDLFPSGQALSPGLSFVNGVISGTLLSTVGSPFSISIRVTDSTIPTPSTTTKSFTLSILPELSINTASLPNGLTGIAYNQLITASGGSSPHSYHATGLPSSLSINPSTGLISGTPASAGTTTNIVVTVADGTTPQFVTSRTYSLTIIPGGPLITTASLSAATATRNYSQQLGSTGGQGTVTWSLAPGSGATPSNTTLSTSGLLSGVPISSGDYSFPVRAVDSQSQFSDKTFTLRVNALPAITTTSLPAGVAGAQYSATLAAIAGTPPLTWSLNGTLPSGLIFNTATGAITGTASASANSALTFTVTDSNGANGSATLQIVIHPPVSITSASPLPQAYAGVAYTHTFQHTGGIPPYEWAFISGALPTGLSLNNAGVLSGTPATATGSPFAFSVRIADSAGGMSEELFALTISGNPQFRLVGGGQAVSQVLFNNPSGPLRSRFFILESASGAIVTFQSSVTTQSGGNWLGSKVYPSETQTGVTGNAVETYVNPNVAPGTYLGAVLFAQTGNPTGHLSIPVTLVIDGPALTILTTTLPQLSAGVSYSHQLIAEGGTGTGYTWSHLRHRQPTGHRLHYRESHRFHRQRGHASALYQCDRNLVAAHHDVIYPRWYRRNTVFRSAPSHRRSAATHM